MTVWLRPAPFRPRVPRIVSEEHLKPPVTKRDRVIPPAVIDWGGAALFARVFAEVSASPLGVVARVVLLQPLSLISYRRRGMSR